MRYCERSVRESCASNEEILRRIYDRMLEQRQPDVVTYRPFTVYDDVDLVHNPGADFSKFFPDFEDGDYAFITSDMDGIFERRMVYNVGGCSKAEVYFNGEKQALVEAPKGTLDANVLFKQGKNRVITKIVAENGRFAGYVRILVPKLRCGADDYVYNAKQYTVAEGFKGQEGIAFSRLYKKNEPMPALTLESIDWIFPVKPEQSEEKSFDFNELCGKGNVAYAHVYIEGRLQIEHESPLKIFAAGKEIYQAERGRFEHSFDKQTPLLIKSVKSKENWGFYVKKAEKTALPPVETDDCPDLHWMWLGPFGRETEGLDYPFAPEINLFYHAPYPSICAGSVYWRFYRPHTYLRQYLMTTFYGQWFYAMMVGMHGLHLAAEKLHITDFYEYFMGGMSLMCRHRDYGTYDRNIFGWTSYMAKGSHLRDLDSIGTIGLNIAEYYLMSGDPQAKHMMLYLADRLSQNIPRFPDGTFHRGKTMWTDDMYMCLPFLARLGAITGEAKYFDEIVTQVTGFYNRMFMHDQHIYSHIYFPEEGIANRIPWGRGNGWVLLAISEALLLMPEDYPGRDRVMDIFKEFAGGVLECRDKKEGIWHQVINNHDSYVETSGSAMFITALARGIRMGWLDSRCTDDVVAAWNALTDKCVDAEGNVYGVCMGSGCNMEEKYYLQLGTIVNDDHGMGIVLGAGVEIMNLLGE
ncbi:MAG: glycoside hydrolase family 105 protein [Clostridia bacterium]